MFRSVAVVMLWQLLATPSVFGQQPNVGLKERTQMVEGVLKIHPKYLFKYYVDLGATGKCALYEESQQAGVPLAKIEPGSRIRVRGRLDTRLHEGSTKRNQSPFPRATVIFMDEATIEILDDDQR